MNRLPTPLLNAMRAPRRLGALLLFTLGWPGCVALAVMVLAAAGALWVNHASSAAITVAVAPTRPDATPPAPVALPPVPPQLPMARDVPTVLRTIEQSAKASGLAWPQAEYRVLPMTDDSLAVLEIRTTLKGSYPSLRRLIATLLNTQPALAMRELSFTRASSDAVEVEARIGWAVFLADGWTPGVLPPQASSIP